MLTYRDEDGCVRIEGCDSSNMEDMLRRCIDRLYEYESVGLTPEGVRKALRELKALKKAEEGTAQAVDCAAVAELFNGICAALPKVKGLSSARRSGIYTADARLRRAGVTWEEFFRRVASSGFLCGKTGWRGCGFDWIIKAANMQKILEGNYDDARRGTPSPSSFDTDEFFAGAMRRSYGEL